VVSISQSFGNALIMSELSDGASAPPNGEARSTRPEATVEAPPAPRTDGLVTNMGALLAAAGVLAPSTNDAALTQATDRVNAADHKTVDASPRRAASEGKERAAPRIKSLPALGTSPTALQDLFLNAVRREAIECTLHFTDGSQERGYIAAFDTFTLLIENRAIRRVQMIYKHAIARIIPARAPAALFNRPDERLHKDAVPNPGRLESAKPRSQA
jgi:RNA chaperone Hfq